MHVALYDEGDNMTSTKLRCDLWVNGYRPVAIKNGQKFPTDKDWGIRARQDPPAIIRESYNPDFSGTGILGDGLRAVDIDLDSEADSDMVAHWCLDNLGDAPIRVRANSPRKLFVYKATEGSPKKASVWNKDLQIGIEVLGHGLQFFAYGRHPSGCELQWMGDLGPANWPVKNLVSVNEHQIGNMLDTFKHLVGEGAKITTRTEHVQFESIADPEVDLEDVRKTLAAIPNQQVGYEFWFSIAQACHRCTGGSHEGYEAWRSWSAQNHRHRDKDTQKVWQALHKNPPTNVGFGTLMHHAKQHDPDFQVGSALDRLNQMLLHRYNRPPVSWKKE